MLIQDCFKGQRVRYKENNKLATVLSVSHTASKITIAFDNAERRDVPPTSLEAADDAPPVAEKPGKPMRPCPNCATKLPLNVHVCPHCGFEYGVKKKSAAGKVFKAVVILAVLAALAYAAWKYLLPMLNR
jgi:hypothetical protein